MDIETQLFIDAIKFIRDNGGWGKIEVDFANGQPVSIKKQILEQHPLKKYE